MRFFVVFAVLLLAAYAQSSPTEESGDCKDKAGLGNLNAEEHVNEAKKQSKGQMDAAKNHADEREDAAKKHAAGQVDVAKKHAAGQEDVAKKKKGGVGQSGNKVSEHKKHHAGKLSEKNSAKSVKDHSEKNEDKEKSETYSEKSEHKQNNCEKCGQSESPSKTGEGCGCNKHKRKDVYEATFEQSDKLETKHSKELKSKHTQEFISEHNKSPKPRKPDGSSKQEKMRKQIDDEENGEEINKSRSKGSVRGNAGKSRGRNAKKGSSPNDKGSSGETDAESVKETEAELYEIPHAGNREYSDEAVTGHRTDNEESDDRLYGIYEESDEILFLHGTREEDRSTIQGTDRKSSYDGISERTDRESSYDGTRVTDLRTSYGTSRSALRRTGDEPRQGNGGPRMYERWYYDAKSKTCKKCVGCKCPEKTYPSEKECYQKCVCLKNEEYVACKKCDPTCEKPDKRKIKCNMLHCVPGCKCKEGFVRNEEGKCIRTCDCPPKKSCVGGRDCGYGGKNLKRWYYDVKSNDCKEFYYGGKGGNGNNYETKDDCMKHCKVCGKNEKYVTCKKCEKTCEKQICHLLKLPCVAGCQCDEGFVRNEGKCIRPCECPPKKSCVRGPDCGYGNKKLKRWYYDVECNDCKVFDYRGKGGNGNNYLNKDDCLKHCKACGKNQHYESCGSACPPTCDCKKTKICTKQCVPGCFCDKEYVKTKDGKCVKPEDCPKNKTCTEKPDCGPCKKSIKMWYYDPKARCCKTFTYGGCGGNGNRYSSEKECMEHCHEKCRENEHFECGTACPKTCKTLYAKVKCSKQKCGCFCNDGYVRNNKGKCVAICQCREFMNCLVDCIRPCGDPKCGCKRKSPVDKCLEKCKGNQVGIKQKKQKASPDLKAFADSGYYGGNLGYDIP